MVVGSIIATGEERGEKGRGGKEDIYVLLTEWRRKIKKKENACKGKRTGNGHKSSPCIKDWCLWQEAISTCSYTTCFIRPVASDLHGLLLRENEGNLEAGATPKSERGLCDWVTSCSTIGCFFILFPPFRLYEQIEG